MIFNLNICVVCDSTKPAAEIILSIKGEMKSSSDGDGAVDAAFNAINKILKMNLIPKLAINNITSGTDAQEVL